MATPVSQIFTEEDLQRINAALLQLDQAKEVIEMATAAGIDVEQFRERARVNREQLLRIKNTFFPGR